MNINDMLEEMHLNGKRIELHNHKTTRMGQTWSIRIGLLSRSGFIGRNDPTVTMAYGETILEAVSKTYEWWKSHDAKDE